MDASLQSGVTRQISSGLVCLSSLHFPLAFFLTPLLSICIVIFISKASSSIIFDHEAISVRCCRHRFIRPWRAVFPSMTTNSRLRLCYIARGKNQSLCYRTKSHAKKRSSLSISHNVYIPCRFLFSSARFVRDAKEMLQALTRSLITCKSQQSMIAAYLLTSVLWSSITSSSLSS